jgi:hypothetical protein
MYCAGRAEPGSGAIPLIFGPRPFNSKIADPSRLPGKLTAIQLLQRKLLSKRWGVQLVKADEGAIHIYIIWDHTAWKNHNTLFGGPLTF